MRIPMGNFGNAVAAPQQEVNVVAPAARAAAGIANDIQQQHLYDQAEAKREAKIAAAEAKAQREAADRATAQAQIGVTRDRLEDLATEFSDGIQNGTIDKTTAAEEWQRRAKEAAGQDFERIPEAFRGAAQNDFDARAARLGNRVGRAVRQRDQSDTAAGIDQTVEYAQRLAVTDPGAGRALALSTIEQLGPFAGLTPEQITKRKQGFVEDVAYARGFSAVTGSKLDNKGLAEAEKAIQADGDLDPKRKAELLDRSAGYRFTNDQRAELAAARAQRQAEAHLRKAEAEFQTFQALADKGGALSQAYIDQAIERTRGTPFQAGIKALAQQAVETGGIAAQPIAVQQAMLDDLDRKIAATGRTPALDKRRDQVARVLDGSRAAAARDPLRGYMERGGATEVAPLDTSSLPGLTGSLAARREVAERAAVWSGVPTTPLTAEEIEPVRRMLDALPPKERSAAVATLAGTLGPQGSAGLAKQLDKTDRPLALAFWKAGARTAPAENSWGRPLGEGRFVSELILKGQQAKKDGTSTKNVERADTQHTQWKRFLTSELEGLYAAQPAFEAYRDTAELVAHGIASEQGGRLSDDDLKRAARLAVGGEIVEHNGRRIPLPAGVTEDTLTQRLRTVSVADISAQAGTTVRAAGLPVPVERFVQSLPGAELLYAGPGRFNVLVQGRPVMSGDGKRPVIVKVD